MVNQPRGAAGKFISKEAAENITEEDLPDLIHKSSKMTGGLKKIKEAKEEAEFDKPLLAVSVNNPLSWFMKILNQLKKKQTTTITFRLGIPLIALPVFIVAFAGVFFGLGKITTKPEEKVIEKEVEPDYYNISKAGILKIIVNSDIKTYYLILPNGEALKMQIPENTNTTGLDGKRILATGKYYTKDQIIIVENITGLEVLPLRPSPIPTKIPTPTSSPVPTIGI